MYQKYGQHEALVIIYEFDQLDEGRRNPYQTKIQKNYGLMLLFGEVHGNSCFIIR